MATTTTIADLQNLLPADNRLDGKILASQGSDRLQWVDDKTKAPRRNFSYTLAPAGGAQGISLNNGTHGPWIGNHVNVTVGEYDKEITVPYDYGSENDTVSFSLVTSKGKLRVRAFLADGKQQLVTVNRNDVVMLCKTAGRWEFQTDFRRAESVDIDALVKEKIRSELRSSQTLEDIVMASFNRALARRQAIRIPFGPAAGRPDNPVRGEFRFNTDLAAFEGWDGEDWVRVNVSPANIPGSFMFVGEDGRELPEGMFPAERLGDTSDRRIPDAPPTINDQPTPEPPARGWQTVPGGPIQTDLPAGMSEAERETPGAPVPDGLTDPDPVRDLPPGMNPGGRIG